MRPWKTLTAVLCLLSILAGPAAAVVFSRGVSSSSLGSCVLTPSVDENSLQLSGLTPTGADGVKLVLDRMTGHSCTFTSSWSSSDAGAAMSYQWTLVSSPSGSRTCTMQRTPSGVTLSGALWVFGGAPVSERRQLVFIHDDVVVASQFVTSSSPLELRQPPGSLAQIPSVSFDTDAAAHLSVCMVSCDSPVECVVGGATVVCDRVAIVADLDGDGVLSDCRLTCAVPPGSALSTLVLSSQSVTRFGHSLTAQGHLHYTGQPDALTLDIDGNQQADALTDGLLLLRYMFGLTGTAVTNGAIAPGTHLSRSSPPAEMDISRANPYLLDPDAPETLNPLTVTVTGLNTCSPTGEVASLVAHELSHVVQLSSRFSGMCADRESVYVSSHGHLVLRAALALDGTVSVFTPPGGPPRPPVCAVGQPIQKSSSNIQNNLVVPGNDSRTGLPGSVAAGSPSAASVVGSDGVSLHMAFTVQRVFLIGGTPPVTGDDITFTGTSSSPVAGSVPITVTGTNFTVTNTGGSATGTLSLQTMRSHAIDQVVASIPPTSALSTTHPVVDIPVDLERLDTTPLRGYSVTIQPGPGLQFAGPITESNFLSRSGQTQCFVTTHPDHSITVDCAILGPGCGPTTGGRLFTVPVSLDVSVPVSNNAGYVDITASEAADCDAGPIPASPGGRSYLLVDTSPPSPVTLTASPVLTGNDRDGTIKIALSWTAPEPGASVEIYRAPYLNYPEYDDGPIPGSPPPAFTYPPASRWTPVTLSCSSSSAGVSVCTDETSSRDVYRFALVVRDAAGNVSAPSNTTPEFKNYHGGDTTDGFTVCLGDNLVTTADVSAMATHYGETVPVGSPLECYDFGPIDGGGVLGRPVTDHRIAFADLIVLAIYYTVVSQPAASPRSVAASTNALRLRVPALPGVGQTFQVAVDMSGAGDAQGVSAQLAFDPSVVEALTVTPGELISRQGRQGVVLSSGPGNVDAALLGVGGGIAGEGELARVTFRVKAPGEPGLGIAGVEGRDSQNSLIAMSGVGAPDATPGRTALRLAFPNPFDKSTTVVLSLHESGPASVRVFDVAGRTVRTLLAGVQPAGERLLAWDGRDDSGARLGAGVYMLRLESGGHQETRAVRLVK